MSWTKQQIVEEAYSELALAGYVFDLSPEEMQTGLRRLDTMIALWNGKGIRLGYPLPSSPDASNLDDDSNLPASAVEAVYLNLAIRLAPGNGKQLSQDTRTSAKDAYNLLLSRAAMPPQQQFPNTLPRGAGSKSWRTTDNPFVQTPDTSPLGITPNGQLEFRGD